MALNTDDLDAVEALDNAADDPGDRGDGFKPSPDALVSEEDLDEEAELTQAARDAAAAAKKAAEEAENKTVVEGDKPKDESKAKVDDKPVREPKIPVSRHKEMLDAARARTAEVESQLAAALKAGTKEQTKVDNAADEAKISTLEETYTKQLADGELKEAAATMKEIRALDKAVSQRENAEALAAVEERAVERVRFDSTVASLEAAYPQLDPKNAAYDVAQVQEVLEMKELWEMKGMTSSAALQKSVKYVMRPATAAQVAATDEVVEKDDDDDGDDAAARKAAAVAKAVKAAAAQPANATKIGIDSDKAGGGALDAKSVMKLSDADFDKLGEKELAALRGDLL